CSSDLLPHIMRPAAPRLADTAAHDEEIDDPPIGHVHMIPVIDPGAEDDHRPAFGLFRIGRKFTRDRDDAISRYTGYFFGPRRRIRFILRSEEHTSELQSRENVVCRLLLENKKWKHI